MTLIVSTILRFTHRTFSRQDSQFTLGDIKADIKILLEPKYEEADIILDFENLDQNQQLYCNRMDITQIIINLVNNAFDAVNSKPKDQERWVKVYSEVTELNFLNIYVEDSGDGIEKGIEEKIMELFFTTKGEKGNGIGLGMCKILAEKNQGDIHLVNDGEHTQFVLSLSHEVLTSSEAQESDTDQTAPEVTIITTEKAQEIKTTKLTV